MLLLLYTCARSFIELNFPLARSPYTDDDDDVDGEEDGVIYSNEICMYITSSPPIQITYAGSTFSATFMRDLRAGNMGFHGLAIELGEH